MVRTSTHSLACTHSTLHFTQVQCRASRALLTEALESGGELVSNVRLAVDNMGAQHRQRIKARESKREREESELEDA